MRLNCEERQVVSWKMRCALAAVLISIVFVIASFVSLSALPYQERLEPAAWRTYNSAIVFLVAWDGEGSRPQKVYALYKGGYQLIGSKRVSPWPFTLTSLSLKSDFYAFQGNHGQFLRRVYRRASIFARFSITYEETMRTPELLAMVAEGVQRLDTSTSALEAELEKIKALQEKLESQ